MQRQDWPQKAQEFTKRRPLENRLFHFIVHFCVFCGHASPGFLLAEFPNRL
jgi:hypothetical protein